MSFTEQHFTYGDILVTITIEETVKGIYKTLEFVKRYGDYDEIISPNSPEARQALIKMINELNDYEDDYDDYDNESEE